VDMYMDEWIGGEIWSDDYWPMELM